jgi:hypothetical protein
MGCEEEEDAGSRRARLGERECVRVRVKGDEGRKPNLRDGRTGGRYEELMNERMGACVCVCATSQQEETGR